VNFYPVKMFPDPNLRQFHFIKLFSNIQ